MWLAGLKLRQPREKWPRVGADAGVGAGAGVHTTCYATSS